MSGELIEGAVPASAAAEGGDLVRAEARRKGWVRSGELGKTLGVGDQTVRNWRDAGMPVAGVDGLGIGWFDMAACVAWAKVQKPGYVGRGGKRVGAGKKARGGAARKVGSRWKLTGGNQVSGFGDRVSGGGGNGVIDFAAAGEGEGEEKKPAAGGGVPRVEDLHPTQRIEYELKEERIRQMKLESDREAGKWLPTDEVVGTVQRVMTTVRERFETLPVAATPLILARCSLDPGMAPELMTMLGDLVGRALEELATLGEMGRTEAVGSGE